MALFRIIDFHVWPHLLHCHSATSNEEGEHRLRSYAGRVIFALNSASSSGIFSAADSNLTRPLTVDQSSAACPRAVVLCALLSFLNWIPRARMIGRREDAQTHELIPSLVLSLTSTQAPGISGRPRARTRT